MSGKFVIILGMHRSGTSMLTRIANFLGLGLELDSETGGFVKTLHNDNETGFWELQEVVDINEKILNHFGIGHLDAKELPQNWLSICNEDEKIFNYIKNIEEIISRGIKKYNLFGIKDPRICRLLPLWTESCKNLNIEPVFIFSIRHPMEVATSLHKRNNIDVEQGLELWQIYNQEAELYSRNYKRYFVSFPDIINGWERSLLEAERYLGIKWSYSNGKNGGNSLVDIRNKINSFIQSDLYHNKAKESDFILNNNIKLLYDNLYKASLIQELAIESKSIRNMNEHTTLLDNKNNFKTNLVKANLNRQAKKVCIATPDIIGPTRNGGIGTSYYNLAVFLREKGFDVTILYLLGDYVDSNVKSIDGWISWYEEQGIKLVLLELSPDINKLSDSEISKKAYDWLKDKSFDIIHFPDWRGLVYHCSINKKLGSDFANTVLCIGLHSPTKWHNQFNDINSNIAISAIKESEWGFIDFMEKQAVYLADMIVSPSQYLIDWYKENNRKLPGNQIVIQNISNTTLDNNIKDVKEIVGNEIKEIVFFGRLEIRKGIEIFCDAIQGLSDDIKSQVNFTFLGKISEINGEASDIYIENKLVNKCADKTIDSDIKYTIIDNLNSNEAIKYLSGTGRVAVIASLMENSPYVLLEVMSNNIPFIVSNAGGIIELIDSKSVEINCFSPYKDSLLNKIKYIIENKAISAKLAIDSNVTKNKWLELHQNIGNDCNIEQNYTIDDSNINVGFLKAEISYLLDYIENNSNVFLNIKDEYFKILGDVQHQKKIIEQHNITIKQKNQEIIELDNQISNLSQKVNRQEVEINNLKHKVDSEIKSRNYEVSQKEKIIQKQQHAYEKTIAEYKEAYEAVINSTSWKITKPLRNIKFKKK